MAERTAELAAANAKLVEEAEQRERAEGRFQHLVEGVVDYAHLHAGPDRHHHQLESPAAAHQGISRAARSSAEAFRAGSSPRRTAPPACRPQALETARREGKYEAEGWRVRKDGRRILGAASCSIHPRQGRRAARFRQDHPRHHRTARGADARCSEPRSNWRRSQKMEGIGQLTGRRRARLQQPPDDHHRQPRDRATQPARDPRADPATARPFGRQRHARGAAGGGADAAPAGFFPAAAAGAEGPRCRAGCVGGMSDLLAALARRAGRRSKPCSPAACGGCTPIQPSSRSPFSILPSMPATPCPTAAS